jgi:hypothetical protein
MSYVSEWVSYLLAGVLIEKIGAKWTFFSLLLISTVAGVAILTYGLSHPDYTFSIMVFFGKFGVSGCFTAVYIGHPKMFPFALVITSMGFCNFIARTVTIYAPILAE